MPASCSCDGTARTIRRDRRRPTTASASPAPDRRKVFEMFYRSDQLPHAPRGRDRPRASPSCAASCAGHKGRVGVEAGEGGVGTVFRVRIPLDRQAQAALHAESREAAALVRVPGASPHGKVEGLTLNPASVRRPRAYEPGASIMSSRILIVEDDPSIRLGLKRSLEFEGFTVDLARDGEEAIQRAFDKKPDLIVLDIMLPRVNGFEVCRTVRKYDSTIPDPDPLGQGRRGRQGARARAGRRRLHHEALLRAGADGAHQGGPAAAPGHGGRGRHLRGSRARASTSPARSCR